MKFLILILFFFAISNVKAGPGDGTGGIGGGVAPTDFMRMFGMDDTIYSPRVGVPRHVHAAAFDPRPEVSNPYLVSVQDPGLYTTPVYAAKPVMDYLNVKQDHILISPSDIQTVQDIYGTLYDPSDLYGTQVDQGEMFRFEINDPRFVDIELVNDEVIDLNDDSETILDLWGN